MSSHIVPCERPENNPEDWFIERDGKQYPDDAILTEEQYRAAVNVDIPGSTEMTSAQLDVKIEASIAAAEEEATKVSLVRRRHAKDKCHVECYFRLQCLTMALEDGHTSGTWGGYYPEELREIRKARDARAAGVS